MMVKLTPVVNFINVLRAAFTPADPKSAKKTVKLSSFFPLLGSAGVKASRRMLVKLTPGDLAGTSKHCKHTDIVAFREPSKLAGKSRNLQQTGSAQFACPHYNTNSNNNTDANSNSTEIRKNAKNPTDNAANTSANTTNTKNAKETNNSNNTNTC